jgi:hypothetical protein
MHGKSLQNTYGNWQAYFFRFGLYLRGLLLSKISFALSKSKEAGSMPFGMRAFLVPSVT